MGMAAVAMVGALGWVMQGAAIAHRFRCCIRQPSPRTQPMRDEVQGAVEGVLGPLQPPVPLRIALNISAPTKRYDVWRCGSTICRADLNARM
jgi:hypothetical protein